MNHTTGAERRNKRMFAIFERAKELKKIALHNELIRLLKDVDTVLTNNTPAENLFCKYLGEERACNLKDDIKEALKRAEGI